MKLKETLFFARLKRIEFENFRNIENGGIDLPNSKTTDFLSESPSILGLYGQNGSGKSSVIMALGILKTVLSGESLEDTYQSCIKIGCDRCTLKYTFAMYSKLMDDKGESVFDPMDASCYDVFYQFDITKYTEPVETEFYSAADAKEKLMIENEILQYRITTSAGKVIIPKQVLIDTREKPGKRQSLFGSEAKEQMYSDFDDKIVQKYNEILAVSKNNGQSFVFSLKTINLLEQSLNSVFFDNEEVSPVLTDFFSQIQMADAENSSALRSSILDKFQNLEDETQAGILYYFYTFTTPFYLIRNLRTFGRAYLYVIDTTMTGLTNVNTELPLLLWQHIPNRGVYTSRVSLQMNGPTSVSEKSFQNVKQSLCAVSDVLEKIVPNTRLNVVDLGRTLSKSSEEEHSFEITSQRGDTTLPLKYESDGIRRIVSILSLLIAAYNDRSFTIAIDEFDSGIFEYLLGEILSIMSESIKGQLIFTSHNLRPLEVLPSKFLCFTTTSKNSRFIAIPNRGNSNLRDNYYRSIILNTQKAPVYNPTDRYEIETAFYRAGHPEVAE